MTKMGFKRNPFERREPINKVSKKQAKRTQALGDSREMVLSAIHGRWGKTFCMAEGQYDVKCLGRLEWDHVKPRSRQPENVDSCANGQLICTAHHRLKTQTPGMYDWDFRSSSLKAWMKSLDKEAGQ